LWFLSLACEKRKIRNKRRAEDRLNEGVLRGPIIYCWAVAHGDEASRSSLFFLHKGLDCLATSAQYMWS
jgi:hypothetical protein